MKTYETMLKEAGSASYCTNIAYTIRGYMEALCDSVDNDATRKIKRLSELNERVSARWAQLFKEGK